MPASPCSTADLPRTGAPGPHTLLVALQTLNEARLGQLEFQCRNTPGPTGFLTTMIARRTRNAALLRARPGAGLVSFPSTP